MSDGTFGFLPWMRQGLANQITQADNANGGGTPGRATMQVTATFNGQNITKTVQLVGPGDILGISADVVIRTEPKEHVFDYEASSLPYIEFYEEDFPWRYTPAQPVNKKLRPWLALIVLKDDEFTLIPATGSLPASIQITGALSDILHPHSDHWAWAHTHVNTPADSTSEFDLLNDITTQLPSHPDMAVSRLLCSRRLEPQTQYTAFLIPAFETGRRSGLGIDSSGIDSLAASWHLTDINHISKAAKANYYPVYKQWRFGTGALGDFETLVRALKPRPANAALGTVRMDINHAGMTLDGLASPAEAGMEGALAPPLFVPVTAKNKTDNDPYTQKLKELLNLSADMQSGTVTLTDPVIAPPMYGQWHAGVTRVDATGTPLWLQELNLDPRYRAAAGLGAGIVRARQEEFMEQAWKQIGEVMAVNEKIAKAGVAIAASQQIYEKHLIGKNTTAVSADDRLNNTLKIAAQLLKQVKVPDPSNTSAQVSAARAATISAVGKGSVDAGFRKMVRNRSKVVMKMNGTTADISTRLVANLNSNIVNTALPHAQSPGAIPVASFSQPAGNGGNSTYDRSNVSNASSATVAQTVWTNIYANQVETFRDTISYYNTIQPQNPPAPAALSTGYTGAVLQGIRPDYTISKRVIESINLQLGGNNQVLSGLKPVMAYPVIDEPLFDDLVNISPDYLLPNLNSYPTNSVTLLQTNTRFIEAYMAGLNHEFARELLWREYPTDQRGSYFRRFWDITDTLNPTTGVEYFNDIRPMHQWPLTAHLGENHTIRHGNAASKLVLLIRGDLLKKYANTFIYAQKAVAAATTSAPRGLASATDSNGDISATNIRFPIFKAHLQPDVVLLGFDLTKEEALGTPWPGTADPGWFFVFRERPGQLRFGLDEPTGAPVTDWDGLSWAHMTTSAAPAKTITIANADPAVVNPLNNAVMTDSNIPVTWGGDAALMAWILYQKPVMVAMHAQDLIMQ